MKNHLSIVLFGIAAISLTGCYTQLLVPENNDTYVYHEPIPVIICYPAPEPILVQAPLPYPPTNPVKPEYKTRPITPPRRDGIRNPGKKRDPVTPPQRDDIRNPGKRRNHVTQPPSNDRIKDDSRNPGGRNDGGRKNRR
ncbi:MAG: hypothetical protein IH852_03580 [Bacteroidetes bacterium]|nr:hypothetical protein [Bacteroidota bacterium]